VTGAGNLGFAWLATDPLSALPFRFLTGAGIAAVYPVGMNLIAGWFRVGLGTAIGILIGALTVGTALPHLLRPGGAAGADCGSSSPGRRSRLRGGAAVLVGADPGPFDTPAPRFSLRIGRGLPGAVRPARQSRLPGHLGFFAMWTGALPRRQLRSRGSSDAASAALAAFAVIGAGGSAAQPAAS
jgi:hypothetical protein